MIKPYFIALYVLAYLLAVPGTAASDGQSGSSCTMGGTCNDPNAHCKAKVCTCANTHYLTPPTCTIIKPEILDGPSSHVHNVGETVTLLCQYKGASLTGAVYRFHHDQKKIGEGPVNTMELQSVQKSDAGKYECYVVLNDGVVRQSNTIDIIVVDQPKLIMKPSNRVWSGADVTLICRFFGQPMTNYMLSHDAKEIRNSKVPFIFHLIKNAKRYIDDGFYGCLSWLNGMIATQSEGVELKIADQPVLTVTPADSTVIIGTSVEFLCYYGEERTGLTYTFFRDDKPISSGTVNKFVLQSVQRKDSGIYNCDVTHPPDVKHPNGRHTWKVLDPHKLIVGSASNQNGLYCDSMPCKNGAACSNDVAGFLCSCAPGYTGKTCSIAGNSNGSYCNSTPCKNGAACSNNVTVGFLCSCAPGYTGKTCSSGSTLNNVCSSKRN